MKKRALFEFKRKFIHLLSLFFIAIYILLFKVYSKQIALLSLCSILLFFIILEYIRIIKKKKIPFFEIFFRDKEKNKTASYVYFLLGIIIAFSIFDFRIALVSILMTVFGDTMAAIVGINFGKHKIKNSSKSWEGTIAELVTNLIICFILLDKIVIILAMALIATLVETFFIHIEDNLAVPISSGLVGQLLTLIN